MPQTTPFAADLMTFRRTISAAELASLDSNPVELLPRPNEGQYLHLVSADFVFVGGSAAFTADSALEVVYGSSPTGAVATVAPDFLEATENQKILCRATFQAAADEPDFVHVPLFLTCAGDPPADGNGFLTILGSFYVFDA